ncbi:pyridoxal phosphate-dependent transferase [Syncephalastrum racemosum]|uniref:Pyridoxal phosphate-dependent transferase n=1 Tax=Syncephalastrum racemosum TaxID=13706 RepID=A0A1X2HE63_SYNRA|nr:pyridoxal phosphate-dependent transferase [Syncephalastrum racemosum]
MLRRILQRTPLITTRTRTYTTHRRVYDLTSDTVTEPTEAIFDAMRRASRKDDVYNTDASVHALQDHVARLLGHEAALFCASATMTNQLGLRALLTQPPHSVLLDARSHIHQYECGGLAFHSQASTTAVTPTGLHLTADQVQANLIGNDIHNAPTKVIALENTLNGTIMPLDAIRRIKTLADSQGLKMHLDGARLWNASQETGIPMADYGRCFDTISLCVSKGVGAPIGSLLVGSRAIIERARHLRKLLGGGWRQAGPLAAAAHHCIEHVVPTMPDTHRLARRLADGLQSLGLHLVLPCHTNMVFVDLAPLRVSDLADALAPHDILISPDSGTQTRLVLHYQIPDSAVDTLLDVTQDLLKKGPKAKSGESPARHAMPSYGSNL